MRHKKRKANSSILVTFYRKSLEDNKTPDELTTLFIDVETHEFSHYPSEIEDGSSVVAVIKTLDPISTDEFENAGYDIFDINDKESAFWELAKEAFELFKQKSRQIDLTFEFAFYYDSWCDDTPDGREWDSCFEFVGIVYKKTLHTSSVKTYLKNLTKKALLPDTLRI